MKQFKFVVVAALVLASCERAIFAIDDAFIKQVSPLPSEQQVQKFIEKMKELNPGFEGVVHHKIKGNKIVELSFAPASVTNISPIRIFRHLDTLRIGAERSPKDKRTLSDISPLHGLPLSCLEAGGNRISDLSPLHGMPLRILRCSDNPIKDLSPLKGSELHELHVAQTEVSDLTPLRGMPLRKLCCEKSRVTDLSPLKNSPLSLLRCDFVAERDTKVLLSIKTLDQINNLPKSTFWNREGSSAGPQPDSVPPVESPSKAPVISVPAPVATATPPAVESSGATPSISTNKPAVTPPSYASRLAAAAETRYNKTLTVASQQYLVDLDAAMKTAMRDGKLDEANAIRDATNQIKAGKLPGTTFKSVFANTAKTRYEQAATVAVQQYLRELDAAQKAAMNAGNLDEANAINATRKQLERK